MANINIVLMVLFAVLLAGLSSWYFTITFHSQKQSRSRELYYPLLVFSSGLVTVSLTFLLALARVAIASVLIYPAIFLLGAGFLWMTVVLSGMLIDWIGEWSELHIGRPLIRWFNRNGNRLISQINTKRRVGLVAIVVGLLFMLITPTLDRMELASTAAYMVWIDRLCPRILAWGSIGIGVIFIIGSWLTDNELPRD